MRYLILVAGLMGLSFAAACAEPPAPTYKKVRLTDKFYCEGAYFADFNKDGKPDVVSGPFWYEGPDFQKKHEIREPKTYDPHSYADNFLTYTGDFNGDGWADVFYVPWPGADGFWYENPGAKGGPWKQHHLTNSACNETPIYVDLFGAAIGEGVGLVAVLTAFGAWAGVRSGNVPPDPPQSEPAEILPWFDQKDDTRAGRHREIHLHRCHRRRRRHCGSSLYRKQGNRSAG